MDFRLLGPLEVLRDQVPVRIAAGKQRALLAILLLNANRTVSREQLIDSLWGENVPESAQKMVQIQVSQLRKALPEPRLHTRQPGYMLEVREDELDVARFERALANARSALAQGEPESATELLDHALALWRGSALAEFSEPFARHEGARLEELRLAAVELRIEADLALGHQREVVSELETLIAQHPLRERLRSQHMLALYRSGRHAEALASYQTFRRTLAEELGIEPSASLRGLERLMLQQDPSLELPARTETRAAAPAPGVETVSEAPGGDVSYARSGDIRIAYQVVGNGPVDLVLVHGWICTFQPGWEYPKLAAFYRRLASMGRLILFDKRGTGLSDRVSPERLPDLETRMDDVRAALDEDDWAQAATEEWLARVSPDLLRDPAAVRWYVSYIVRGASPGANRAIRLMNEEIDIRDVLPTISVPTLVLYRSREYFREGTRFMGEHIPGAQLVELHGTDHLPWEGDRESVLDEIERFLSGVREEVEPDRVLATLLFTDVVGSTAKAAELGDRAWHELLTKHHRLVRAQLARFRGREVDMAGDGLFATFDGPARAVRCASAIADGLRTLGLDVRAGVHTGEIEQTNGSVRGIAVHIASRIAAAARPGEVLVSSTVKDIVAGSGIAFEERGEHELDGVPGTWRLFTARI